MENLRSLHFWVTRFQLFVLRLSSLSWPPSASARLFNEAEEQPVVVSVFDSVGGLRRTIGG